jgi:3',5'-cyclic AMP phosphodiesterase CpdA
MVCEPNDGHANKSHRFVQLSDLHLSSIGAPNPLKLLNKRLLGYLSWLKRKRATHQKWVLDCALETIHELKPDYHLITGDLTHIGLKHEFIQCREWLDRLTSANNMMVIPGNHDLYVDSKWDESFALWEQLMCDDPTLLPKIKQKTAAQKLDQIYPQVRVRDNVAFIALSSIYPAPWFKATGRINEQQMMRLKFVLRDPELASCCKVLLLHHPITLTHTAKRKQLINSEQLCELLQQYPVELVLHGHGHTSTIDYLDHENGSRTPIIGMASSSSISQKLNQRAEFKLYEITQQTHKLELTMQNYVLDQQLKQFIASDKTQIV